MSWAGGGAWWRWGAAAQPQHSLHPRAPCTPSLDPSSILSADGTSGSLQGDAAKGCTQGSKSKHIFRTKSRVGYSRAPGSEACAVTHTFVRARRVYLKVLLLAL